MVLVGGMIPSGMLLPAIESSPKVLDLPSTWQIPALLLCALICGPVAGVIASAAYLTIGLFQIPVFHDGGSINYLFSPGFGYLAGFIPAAWVTGKLSQQRGMNDLLGLTFCSLIGVMLLQACGVLNLVVGCLIGRWPEQLQELLFNYSIAPFPTQLALLPPVGMIGLLLKRLLFIE